MPWPLFQGRFAQIGKESRKAHTQAKQALFTRLPDAMDGFGRKTC